MTHSNFRQSRRRRTPELSFWGRVVALALLIPALMLLIAGLTLLMGLLGALPMLLIWNHGLTTFLAATGLGTVSTVGFWQAFWLAILGFYVGFLLRGSSYRSNKSE